MNDLISIIIPIYDAELYIEECMKCVLHQTYCNLEVILVDDGSEDRSAELCEKYLKMDNRIKYFYKNNGGAASARNFGIKQAHGKYLYFMDVDDLLDENAVELLHNAYITRQVDFVIGNVKHINIYGKEELEWTVKDRIFEGKDSVRKLVYAFADDMKSNKILYSAWGKLYRTDIIKSVPLYFNEKMHTHEDNVFVLAYLSNCNSLYYIGKCIYTYRNFKWSTNKRSYSETGWLTGFLDFRYIVKEVRKILPGKKYNQVIGNFYSEYAILTMFHCCRQIKICSVNDLKKLYFIIYRIVKSSGMMQISIKYYVQKHDDNAKIIPFLIKKEWIMLIIIVFKLQLIKQEKKNKPYKCGIIKVTGEQG